MSEIVNLPVSSIEVGQNDRTVFGDNQISDLAASIQSDGLIQPITVRPIATVCPRCNQRYTASDNFCFTCTDTLTTTVDVYQIVAGERRFRACLSLGWQTIPAIVRPLTDEQASTIMLIENVHRVDIDPIDEATAYEKRLRQFGWTTALLAKKANVSAKRVDARLRLLKLNPDIQKLVQHGHLGVGFAECMTELDTNRQTIAMRYFQTGKRPLLREFREICGKLLAEQSQESLFDFDAFCNQVIDDQTATRAQWQQEVYPTNPSLPAFKRHGTIGASFEHYIHLLLEAGQSQAASIVGTVYHGMLTSGMAYPPHGPSPLRSGATVRP